RSYKASRYARDRAAPDLSALVKRHHDKERNGHSRQDRQSNQAVDQLQIDALHRFFGIDARAAVRFFFVIHTSMTPRDPSSPLASPEQCRTPRRQALLPPVRSPPTTMKSAGETLRKS